MTDYDDYDKYDEIGDNLDCLIVNPYFCFPRRRFDRQLALEQVGGDLPWFVDLACGLIRELEEDIRKIRSGKFDWSGRSASLTGMRGACLNLGFNTLAWIWHVAHCANMAVQECKDEDAIWCVADFTHAYLGQFQLPVPAQPLTVTELALVRDELPTYAVGELEYAREILAEFLTTIERSFIKVLVQGVHTASDDEPLGRLRAHPLFDPNVLLEIDEVLTGTRKQVFLTQKSTS